MTAAVQGPAPYDGTVTRGSTSGRRRALALLLTLGAAMLGLTYLAPAKAAAATVPGPTITLTGLTVSGTKPTDAVTLQATVSSISDVPAYGVQVILWRSRDPIRDLPTLRQARTNATGWGARLPINADHYAVVTTSTEDFAPGASHQVDLHATLAELGFDTKGAAYAFGADVIAAPDPTGDYATVSQLRTFVALPGKKAVPVTSIVQLSAPPTKLVDNLFRNEDLLAQLGGRLAGLLSAASRHGMSWLIDPGLLDEVNDMADGYQVVAGDATKPGTGAAVAAQWLAEFGELNKANGGRTLFASPDVNGARVAGDQQVLPRAKKAAQGVDNITSLPLMVVPAGGMLTAATYDFMADSGASAIIVANPAQAGALQAGPGKPKVLAVSTDLAGPTDIPVIERSQLAQASAVIAGSGGQARLLTSLSDLAKDSEAAPSWMGRRTLGELLETSPSVTRAAFTPVKPARLGKAQFATIGRLERDFAAYGELVPSSELTEQAAAALSRCAASAWVDDPAGLKSHTKGLVDLVGAGAVGRSVDLHASARFLMSSRTNEFPVTVTNNLTEPIEVRVVVTTDNPQRLTIPPSEVVSVQPGQSVTVNIRPEATANGLVTARAHVSTEAGHRITPDTAITVEITDLGVVAWIIVGVSGLVLVGATVWRIRQVRRRDAAAEVAGKA